MNINQHPAEWPLAARSIIEVVKILFFGEGRNVEEDKQ
jgi:hypothetical protein